MALAYTDIENEMGVIFGITHGSEAGYFPIDNAKVTAFITNAQAEFLASTGLAADVSTATTADALLIIKMVILKVAKAARAMHIFATTAQNGASTYVFSDVTLREMGAEINMEINAIKLGKR